MLVPRCTMLLALVALLTASTAFAAEREELKTVFLKIDGDSLWVLVGKDGRKKDYPIPPDAVFLRDGKRCKREDLREKDKATLTFELPDKGKPYPPRLVMVEATSR